MNTRRAFLKSVLGITLISPAAAACRHMMQKRVVLPAEEKPMSMFMQHAEQYRRAEEDIARYRAAFPNHAIFPTRTRVGPCHHPQNFPRAPEMFSFSKRTPHPEWDMKRYSK